MVTNNIEMETNNIEMETNNIEITCYLCEKTCYLCEKTLSFERFEKERTECKTCRGQKLKRNRLIKGIVDKNVILRDETRKRECDDKCQCCGINIKYISTFDHLEPENKLRSSNGNTINSLINISFDAIQEELKKPHRWLCYNCHKIKTKETTHSTTRDFGCIINHELIKILGDKCELCNESRDFTLTFDHIIEENKTFTIGDKIQQLRLTKDGGVNTIKNIKMHINKICSEVKKCGLLCNNCNWMKNDYKQLCNSKFELIKEFYTTKEGEIWVEKLEEYKYKQRIYNIDEEELFELANTYKNEIIDEKFNEYPEYLLDSSIYLGSLKIKYSQYGRITLHDYIRNIINKSRTVLPLYISYMSNSKTTFRVIFGNHRKNGFKTLENAISYKQTYLLDDIRKNYGTESSVYSFIESILK